jgi:hypothetical protein
VAVVVVEVALTQVVALVDLVAVAVIIMVTAVALVQVPQIKVTLVEQPIVVGLVAEEALVQQVLLVVVLQVKQEEQAVMV